MKTQSILQTLVFSVAISIASTATSDVVTDWNSAALDAIRADRTPPPVASRALAILHASIYDAVNGILRTHEPYSVKERGPLLASPQAAASAAAHKVLITLFPGSATSFEEIHQATLAEIREAPFKRRGIGWGQFVAEQILQSRDNHKSTATVPPPTGSGAGAWKPTPPGFMPYLLPQWGTVTPFAIPSGDFFRPEGPPALQSPEYTAEYNEVKAIGAATNSTRTPEQTQIALFWADGAGTVTPPGHWNVIAQDVAASRRNTMPQNARLFALLNIAMADAAISAWDAKYYYNFWRPITAIREGETDGNPDTAGDPAWSSFIPTPPFPDYISGHSTFSGAAAAVLSLFYGRIRIPFTTTSDGLPDVERSYRSFLEAAGEAAVSRMYGGIHFRSANEDGLRVGLSIGEWTFEHVMRRQ